MFVGIFIALPPVNEHEGYIVRICNGDTQIKILKTTPEQDQIEICKAAKKLEPEAHRIAERRRNLDLMASKCK
jgi:hypothetical protein